MVQNDAAPRRERLRRALVITGGLTVIALLLHHLWQDPVEKEIRHLTRAVVDGPSSWPGLYARIYRNLPKALIPYLPKAGFDPDYQWNVAGRLEAYGPRARSALSALEAAFDSQDISLRKYALRLIVAIAGPDAGPFILKATRDSFSDVRTFAMYHAGLLGTNWGGSVPMLIAGLDDSDLATRRISMSALAKMVPPQCRAFRGS